MRALLINSILLLFCGAIGLKAQNSPTSNYKMQSLKVSSNNRFLIYEDGKPFFYLGDTAWELFHRLTYQEADTYMENRKSKGFTVLQSVALAELDGIDEPNAMGHTPMQDHNPSKLNEDYFKDVDAFIKLAASKGLYIGLLPTWGDKLFKSSWGKGPEIFNSQNIKAYGKFLGSRYKYQKNIIWILGGDRNPRDNEDVKIWNALAEGIAEGVGGYDKAIMTYHPQPKENGGSSTWFHSEKWLSFNMMQTGHCLDGINYKKITYDYNLKPTKPVIDGEPLYEDHPICFDWKKNGFSVADDVRKLAYWQVFAGAFGHTYGCHAIWQFYAAGREPVNAPQRPWTEAMNLPGASQMGYVKKLMLSQTFLDRIPDQSLIIGDNPNTNEYCSATRASDGHYAFIYTPTGRDLKIKTSILSGSSLFEKWYNPREGTFGPKSKKVKNPEMIFSPPTKGGNNDWVLVLTNN
ncbi:MAG: glycoside hydrolase family 140 protein [Pedobacter sp.]|nr:glycoside hydrolase family 140 protein [Pedobacter sp.]